MFSKIIFGILTVIVGIPILLWFLIRGIFTGSWHLLGFICQRQYRELKRLCEHGTVTELQAFLTAHPGAIEYIVYTRRNKITSLVTVLFRLPAPLAVASQANNLAVIPVLLANGASPEVRSVSAKHTPAEEAIGEPERMRALCQGQTWWLERSADQDSKLATAIQEDNERSIVWHVMRGSRLNNPEQLYSLGFMKLPMVIKQFVCRFGIPENHREEFQLWIKKHPVSQKHVEKTFSRLFKSTAEELSKRLEALKQVPVAMEQAMQPLPLMDSTEMDRMLFSIKLMGRPQMEKILDSLYNQEQIFALLKQFTETPVSQDKREATEGVVDLLLCSLLTKTDQA